MLDDARMAKLLVDLKTHEGVDDRTSAQAFGYGAVLNAIATEWNLNTEQAYEALRAWAAGRGEIAGDADPPLLLVHADAWRDLVAIAS